MNSQSIQTTRHPVSLEEQIEHWRSYLRRRQGSHPVDVEELENRMREQVKGLVNGGLAADEAFMVALKRIANLDALSREFARENSDRLWRELVRVPPNSGEVQPGRRDAIAALCLAVAAAVAIKVPALFGVQLDEHKAQDVGFYARNLSFFVLPLLALYFVWKRRLNTRTCVWLALAFIGAGLFGNVYPFTRGGHTEIL
ncbi:MAG TPA: hypothetical protein VJ063_02260, partial [Verrucomicrobiae bacterium]|nr:hypothetical protein [Verrucomicrobiae bacterium]